MGERPDYIVNSKDIEGKERWADLGTAHRNEGFHHCLPFCFTFDMGDIAGFEIINNAGYKTENLFRSLIDHLKRRYKG